MLCDPDDLTVLAGIELDDASHASKKVQKRDALLKGACESAGSPLVRIKAARAYVVSELRELLLTAVGKAPVSLDAPNLPPGPVADVPELSEGSHSEFQAVSEEAPEFNSAQSAESPPCPKCGSAMARRVAKSGANVGNEFWGCTRFPKCRSMVALDPPDAENTGNSTS